NINVPAGSHQTVTQQVFIPGQDDGTFNFTATSDEPWVTISPSSGILPPSGVTLNVTFDPSELPNGTFTSTIIVTLNPLTATSNARTSVSAVIPLPISISVVTPVAPASKTSTPANALIIP